MGYAVLSRYRAELMGCAMLWVMLYHFQAMAEGLGPLEWLCSAGFGGVDVFVLLSAMGLVLSLGRREQGYEAFMARRAGRVLPAYLAVMVPYTLWGIAQGTAWTSALFWNASLLYYWVRPIGAFNWYVAGIMTFYALAPLCFRLLRARRRRALWTAAAVLLSLALCQLLIREGWWQYTDFFYRVPVFFLGLLLGFFLLEDRPLGPGDALFWALWAAAGAGYLCIVLKTRYEFAPLCHLFLFSTAPMCLAGCLLFEKLPLGGLRRFLRLAGENSLEIYLLNVSFFNEAAGRLTDIAAGPGRILGGLGLLAANLALGVLLHRAVEALKAAFAAKTRE